MKLKNIFKLTALAGVLIGMTGCSEEDITPLNPNDLPEVGEYNIIVQVDETTNEFTLSLDQECRGVYPVWRVYANAKNPTTPSVRATTPTLTGVIRKAGDYNVELQLGNRNGLSEGVRTAVIHIPNDLGGGSSDVFKGYKYDSAFNMWKNANVTLQSTWFADDNWGELSPQPEVELSNEYISFHTPAGMGSSQWQGQVHVGTDIQVSSAETYDFSCYVEAVVDTKITVKVQKDGDDNTFFVADQQEFKAGGSVYHFSGLPGFDGTLKIAFDVAGYPETDFAISNIVFKNHKDDDGTVFPVFGYTYDGPNNLWKDATISNITTWFADAGWAEVAAPKYEVDNQIVYVEGLPENTDQWQGQLAMELNIPTSADKTYDFSVLITATADHPGITVKLTDPADDNNFMCADRVAVTANTQTLYHFSEKAGLGTESLKLVLDFGGATAGTNVTLENFVLIDHSLNTETLPGSGEGEGETGDNSGVEWSDADNLWKGYEVSSFWFADGNWAQIADPKYEFDGWTYYLHIAEAGPTRWQGQMHIKSDIVSTSANNYDFKIMFTSTADLPAVMVKLHPDGDDGTFYMEHEVAVTADTPTVYAVGDLPGIESGTPLVLTLDFAGAPANTDVEISDIYFQVHK